jgi:hypothetical protein
MGFGANTSKIEFEPVFTYPVGASIDFSAVSNPVITGDKVVVTAEDGSTKAIFTITVDPADITPPSIIIYTISKTTISPNNDGVDDDTDIDWKFSEVVKANVDIVDSLGNVVFENFYQSNSVTNPQIKTWDGKDSLGVVVPDGIYTIKVVITDEANNTTTDTSKTITINTAIPG